MPDAITRAEFGMVRHFYSTADDLVPVFDVVESKCPLMYTRTGLFTTPRVACVPSGANLPTLGAMITGPDAIACPAYLVTPADVPVNLREVPQAAGGTRYGVDQLTNPDSVIVSPGGFSTPEVLLYGSIGTASDSTTSKALYRAFANAISKRFKRVKAYWVGPQAMDLLRHGCRLAIGANSPRKYDLVL